MAPPQQEGSGAHDSESAKPYLTKLLDGSFDLDDVFTRIALHPNVLAIANRYMGCVSSFAPLTCGSPRPPPALPSRRSCGTGMETTS